MPIWFANHIAFLFFASLPLSKGFIVRGVVSPPVRYETGCDLDAIKLKNTPCLSSGMADALSRYHVSVIHLAMVSAISLWQALRMP